MADVLFFPDNKLNAAVKDVYNGHEAVITQNTDRLKDGKFELAEINLFKYNIQGTSFLNPYADFTHPLTSFENTDYKDTLVKLRDTGRISFGLYYRTDSWVNPSTGTQEYIPSYYETTWGQDAVDAGFNVTLGAAKSVRYPNHGQELYDISSGTYGYDFLTATQGTNSLSEVNLQTERQREYLRSILGKNISTLSYENGRNEVAKLLLPYFTGGRNSSYNFSGNSITVYGSGLGELGGNTLNRAFNINRLSSTRTWDAYNTANFASKQDSIDYTIGEIVKAISQNGWFSDFMHWHSLYELDDLTFFETFFSQIYAEVNGLNIWSAGYNEAIEYMYLRDSIEKIGSFEHDGKVSVFVKVKDPENGNTTDGISTTLDFENIDIPISIEVDLTGTSLDGKNIRCIKSDSVRNLGFNRYIFNVKYRKSDIGFLRFDIEQGATDFYDGFKPLLTSTNKGVIDSNKPCKFVIWEKEKANGISTIVEKTRKLSFSNQVSFSKLHTHDYYIGGITKHGQSSLIQV